MPSQNQITGPSKVKYNGIFKMSDLYRIAHSLLVDMKYQVEEKKYKEKVSQGGRELEIAWDATKNFDDYTRFRITVGWFIVGMVDVETEVEGVKVKQNKADVEITINSYLETDYEGRWETHPVAKFFKGIHDKYLYRSTFLDYQDKIYKEAYKFENEMKAFFNLNRFM
jgi:hypothetical protein